ncbi:MAG: c-type cytochrome [Thiobacillus sp.]
MNRAPLLVLLFLTPVLNGSAAPEDVNLPDDVAVWDETGDSPEPRLLIAPPRVGLSTRQTEVFAADPDERRFIPPRLADLPDNAWGKQVRYGRDLFVDTQRYAGRYVTNGLNCTSCHLSEGRMPGAAPLWAGYPLYPLYRGKNLRANFYQERIGECFRYSMDGISPTPDSREMQALVAYSQWLSTNVPTRAIMAARGFAGVKAPREASHGRGKIVYQSQCALCHGKNGEGVKRADGHGYQFPPLWGWNSYASGAGMNKLTTAAGFIKGNMPLGKGGSLSDQDAIDVALYLRIQTRPWDPRMGWFSIFFGDVADG